MSSQGAQEFFEPKKAPELGTRSRSKSFFLTKTPLYNPFSECPLLRKLHTGTYENHEFSPIQTVKSLEHVC